MSNEKFTRCNEKYTYWGSGSGSPVVKAPGGACWAALATILLLACSAPATVRNPRAEGPGGPAEPPAPAPPATPVAPKDPCEYWGTYEFFHFAEQETVAACLEAGKDPHARVDELGRTPLHNAARAWKEPFIRDLLAAGADINARDWLGRTPLHDAADLMRPVEPDATDVIFIVPFRVHGGPAVGALLEGGADVDARDVRGNTPLHLTWRNSSPAHRPSGHFDPAVSGAAPLLLEAGADPSVLNERGEPADPGSCRNLHLEIFARAAVPQHPSSRFLADPRIFDQLPPSIAEAYAGCVTAGADLTLRDAGGHTVLHHAAAFADTSVIALLLAAGAEADARNHIGTTPLHVAARAGNLAVAAGLLARGADVNVAANGGTTPLHLAARAGNLVTVNALLEAGADPNVVDDHGTALHAFTSSAHRLLIVDALLEAGMDLNLVGGILLRESVGVMAGDSSSQFPLRFLEGGADPNARDGTGWNALHHAFLKGPDVYRVLLDAGADPTAVDNWGASPLHLVAGGGKQGVIPMLVEAGADINLLSGRGAAPLHEAIRHYQENAARVAELLEAGADASLRTEDGDTPLHLVVGASSWPDSSIGSVAEMLVAAGADVNARNGRGETPVESAWLAGRTAVVDRFVALGAEWVEDVAVPMESPSEPVTHGAAPVAPAPAGALQALRCDWNAGDYANFRAPFKFPAASVAGCLAAGTSLELSNEYGQLLISWLPAGDLDVLELLLDAGADLSARDDHGLTPLHRVAELWRADGAYYLAAARALVQAGADPAARGRGGRTPLHAAAEVPWGREEPAVPDMLSLLVEAGSDVNARTDGGQTALHLALHNPAAAVRLLELAADPAARNDSGRVADPASCENFGTPGHFALAVGDAVAGCIGTVMRQGGRVPLQSALHVAAGSARDPGIIGALLQAGASLGERDGEGYFPLHRAAATGTPAVVRSLLEAGANPHRRVEVAQAVASWDPKDWTPLHLAAGNRDPGAAAVLLEAGADVRARVFGYATALHTAARNGNPQVAGVLLDAGAEVDARDEGGRTPLHVAALENSNPDVLSVLIEAGADPEARARPAFGPSLRGLTPVYMAALYGTPEAVEVLAKAGARVDAERAELRPETPFMSGISRSGLRTYGDLGHNSPLHLAALFNSRPAVLVALVRSGADLELRDRMGRTALHIAARHNPRAFPALLALGADPDAVDDEGRTPMDHARLNKNLHGLPEVRRLLVGGAEGARRPGG